MRAALAQQGRRLLHHSARPPSCVAYAALTRCHPVSYPVWPRARNPRGSFQRTFLKGLFQEPPRQVRQPEYEPGWREIMSWRSLMLDNLRPPDRQELMVAWERLMLSKLRRRIPLNSTQALQCRRLLEYLAGGADAVESKGRDKKLSLAFLAVARRVMLDIEPHERTRNHVDFAKALHAVCVSGKQTGYSADTEHPWQVLLQSLSLYGASEEALQMLYAKWDMAARTRIPASDAGHIVTVLRGLAREGLEHDLVQLVEYAQEHGMPYNAKMQAVLVPFFAARDLGPETKRWLAQPTGQLLFEVEVYRALASFALRNGCQDWAMRHLADLGNAKPSKEYWDVLLQGALLVGKGPAEIGQLMSHMKFKDEMISPDRDTLNGLLRVAADMGDAKMADDMLALAADRGIKPDGETHIVLMQLYLKTGDLAAAQDAYQKAKFSEIWQTETAPLHDGRVLLDDYRALLNSYLITLCRQPQPDFSRITALIQSVEEDQILLQPETVAALCLRFLENDQLPDVLDMLSGHSFLFSEGQREIVQDALIGFCTDGATSTRRAWDAYQLLSQFYPETNLARRTRLMEAFFDRRRGDMAVAVFSHMRQHRNRALHPQTETYLRCLAGLTLHPDRKGTAAVHTMFKMDTGVQPTTKLCTAMMLAHTACGRTDAALDLWAEMRRSREGLSYASLEALFWTLERMHSARARERAREIWEMMQRADMVLSPGVYNAFVGAVAGSGDLEGVKEAVGGMAGAAGLVPDVMTLGIAHNALPWSQLQEQFREWAKEEFGETYAELDKLGRRLGEDGLCRFLIKREMRP